jgi:hypothetical protein
LKRAAVRTSLPARANATGPRPLTLPREIGFAPELSRRETRGSAAFFTRQITLTGRKKTGMAATACLIALALGGLILIVLWEIFS